MMSSADPNKSLLKILVVEDSPTQAVFLRQRLVRSGFDVRTVGDGRQAIDEIERQRPTLVLTDLEMPEMNGLELVRHLKQRYPGMPVILLTAQGSEEIAVAALQAGAADYVPKKNLNRDLGKVMERVLALCRFAQTHQQLGDVLSAEISHHLLPNKVALVPPLVRRLQQKLGHMEIFDPTDVMRIGMALHEALVNAIEHGNLEVSSTLRETDESAYSRLVGQRAAESPYRNRRVSILTHQSPEAIEYKIIDGGPGFDPASLGDPTDPANLEKPSGRGLLLIRSFMDEVNFNAAGNEITMIKRRAVDRGGG